MTLAVCEFYDDLADDYDALFVDWDAGVRWQASIIASLLGEAPDPILDIAAGMGTQAIGLASRGYRVVARDLSSRLVERGRREAARLGATIDFEVGDMRDLRPADAGRFGTVIAFDNALPHLENDAELHAALRAAHLSLRPGGRFLASIRDYDALVQSRPAFDPPRLMGAAPARRVVLQVWNWAENARRYELDHLLLREGHEGWSIRSRRTWYRALLRAELESAALAASFVDDHWLMPDATGYCQPIFLAARDRG